jgi:16S rRNA (adenine1518-N6/adenine1519-N6)-dimethyltransferase
MSAPALLPLIDVIRQHGLITKKALGQHFLLDEALLQNIVRAAGDLAEKHVIEIGPGPGGLTRALLASRAASVTAIEKDARCIAALAPLKEQYGNRFTLHEQDALNLTLSTMPSPRVIVANLPYNVGTAMLVAWVEQVAAEGSATLESFTVMLQKEVAERLVATPGNKAYGRLSVLMRQYADIELMFDVPAEAFLPPPKVTSSVVYARILPSPREDVPLQVLERVVAAAFNQRRKMLRQSLKSLGVDALMLCEKADIDPTLRAEQCDLPMFARLVRSL